MVNNPLSPLIDSREPDKIIRMAMKKWPNAEVKFLPVGDFADLSTSTILERKELFDYIGSVKGKRGKRGRIYSQTENMIKNFQNCYIIIIGDFSKVDFNPKVNFTIKQFLGSQASLAARYGVHVMHVKNNSQFFTLADAIFRKSDGERKKFGDIERIPIGNRDVKMGMISAIPSVGPKLAENILEHFKGLSLSELCNLTEDDLRQVDKVGKKKAASIKKWLC